jgi:CelD/BcsL family acetyltransferase involved in cellulose biosynthesis
MPVYQIDPLTDPRWQELAARHPRASVFHSSGWLRALKKTYGYEPIAYTLSPPGSELANAVAFSRIRSWATGQRLVSLPFSDHCEPLVDSDADATEILSHARSEAARNRYRFVEIRPLVSGREMLHPHIGFEVSNSFILHRIDLRPTLDDLFRSFHKDCLQRKIRRAERERLEYKEGRSEDLLRMFFDLLLKTRRKHGLPPQPIAWFQNLVNFLGDHLHIRVALKGDYPVAAIMTTVWKDTLVYKYGCSDPEFSNLGGTPMLFWKAIQTAKADELSWFDLGRSDADNAGLLAFKDHWGAKRSTLCYWRHPASGPPSHVVWDKRLADHLLKRMPDRLLVMAGRLLYKHMG